MTPRLARISHALDAAVTVFCVGCVLVMLGISFTGSFYMFFTGDALSWTYSLARLFIPWLGLLSITVAFRRGEHIAMSSLMEIVPRPIGLAARAANYVIVGVFALLMIWYGTEYAMNSRDLYMVSDQIQVDARWVASSVPITGIILLVHVLCGVNLFDPPSILDEGDLEVTHEQLVEAGLAPSGSSQKGASGA
ncbi:MAG TPA: TRAP transporter small permease subunit [Hyphomicrobiaceae bacterium]